MGVIAHPGPIMGLAVTYDGRKLLTTGEAGVVNVWEVDTQPLEAHATVLAAAAARASGSAESGNGLGPSAVAAGALPGADVSATGADAARWEALVGDDELVEELRDLFTYVQLREAQAAAEAGASGIGGGGGGRLSQRVLTGGRRV
jgi:hypothetical protein